ncbi:hypothetical protein GCM10023185_29730 [Hymenobacter saemangeumensis]|uniref:DUF3168 domain-containing protein n=1 Tax=Hymenobacter saemangeumensis TaxID=1084522 RepID=A0ABP8ILQ2_9BACT
MTYADTVKHLEAVALAVGAGSFWHGPKTNQNINYDAAFPQVHLFLLPAPLEGENVVYQPTLCFYGKDLHEHAANLVDEAAVGQSLDIQNAMDILSQQFINALREAGRFELSERIDRAPVLRKGSTIGTGFLCSFTLKAPAAYLC